MSLLDRTRTGKRVRLVRTNDTYTDLQPGAEGVIRFETHGELGSVAIDWDDGSRLSLCPDIDVFEVLP